MIIFIPILISVLGLLVGSFLGVVISRMHTGRSIVKGLSKCDRCAKTLQWYELIPVVSFLFQRAKCRSCKGELSYAHPLRELVMGIVFVLLYIHTIGLGLSLYMSVLYFMFTCIVASVLMVVFVYDMRHKIIPTELIYVLGALGLGAIGYSTYLDGSFVHLGDALIAGPLVAVPFFLIWFISKGCAMGFGDVLLALVLGWLLGVELSIAMLFVSFWIGGLVGVFLLALTKKYSLKSEVPFAPFMIVATALVFLTGLGSGLLNLWL